MENKNYISPELEVFTVNEDDVITTSPGVETPDVDMGYGYWNW